MRQRLQLLLDGIGNHLIDPDDGDCVLLAAWRPRWKVAMLIFASPNMVPKARLKPGLSMLLISSITGWKSASSAMPFTSTIFAVPALTTPASVRQRPPVRTLIRIRDP